MLERYRKDIQILVRRPPRVPDLLLQPLVTQGARAVLIYRVSSWLLGRGMLRLACACRRVNQWLNGCVIHEASEIGGGFALPHPLGVFIGRKTRIGEGVWVFQNAILGPRSEQDPLEPEIGSYVTIHPGAGVYGPARIGNFTVIGPNVVVYKDVPDGSTVFPPEPRVLAGVYTNFRSEWGKAVVRAIEEKERKVEETHAS